MSAQIASSAGTRWCGWLVSNVCQNSVLHMGLKVDEFQIDHQHFACKRVIAVENDIVFLEAPQPDVEHFFANQCGELIAFLNVSRQQTAGHDDFQRGVAFAEPVSRQHGDRLAFTGRHPDDGTTHAADDFVTASDKFEWPPMPRCFKRPATFTARGIMNPHAIAGLYIPHNHVSPRGCCV